MGLARALRRPQPVEEERGWQWPFMTGGQPLIPSSFYSLPSLDRALRNAASWACINVLTDAMARTPVDIFRGDGTSRRPVAGSNVVTNPSGMTAPDVWRTQLAFSLVTDSNAFGKITGYTGAAWPATIELLDPASVTQREVVDGVPQVRVGGETHQLYPVGDIWHVPGRLVAAGSPFALSQIEYAARTIGTSLSAQDFSYRFFTDGGIPPAVIYSNKLIGDVEARVIKEAWRQATTGNREPVVLGGDLKYERIQVNPDDSQFIDLMRFEVEQACRFWGVPPSMIYGAVSGQSVTYANVTDADLGFLKHSLDGYFVRLENAYTAILPRPQYTKLNRNAILRADVKARMETYALKLANKLATVNECRRLEDEPPFADPIYDKPGLPSAVPAAPVPEPDMPTPQPAMSGNGNGSSP